MWPHVQEMREESTPVTIYSPHFLPSAWHPIISKPFHVDHTYRGIWKHSFHQSWNLQAETVMVILQMCQTDFGSFWSWIKGSDSAYIICTQAHAQEQCKEWEAVPWGLHTVHDQCFMCGMWCSIKKWLHCSMVLQKSTTRIWINPAASLEYLSDVVCWTMWCQQNYSSPSTSKIVRQWDSCKKVDCKEQHTRLKCNCEIILYNNAHYWQMPVDILEGQQLWPLYRSKKWGGIPRGSWKSIKWKSCSSLLGKVPYIYKLHSNTWIDHFQFWWETTAENLEWNQKTKKFGKRKYNTGHHT